MTNRSRSKVPRYVTNVKKIHQTNIYLICNTDKLFYLYLLSENIVQLHIDNNYCLRFSQLPFDQAITSQYFNTVKLHYTSNLSKRSVKSVLRPCHNSNVVGISSFFFKVVSKKNPASAPSRKWLEYNQYL